MRQRTDAMAGGAHDAVALARPGAGETVQEIEMLPPPSFHQDSGAVRFWVATPGGQSIGAILSKQVLQYRFHAQPDGSDAVTVYEANRGDIDAAVMHRVAGGSVEPVILRENDLPLPPRR